LEKWKENPNREYRPTSLPENQQHPLFENKRENIKAVVRKVDWWKILINRIQEILKTSSYTYTSIVKYLKEKKDLQFYPTDVINELLDPLANDFDVGTDESFLQQLCLINAIAVKVNVMNENHPSSIELTEWETLSRELKRRRTENIKKNTQSESKSDYEYEYDSDSDSDSDEDVEEESNQVELPNEISPDEERNDDETNYLNEEGLRDSLCDYGDEYTSEPSHQSFIEATPPNFDTIPPLKFTNTKYIYSNYNENANKLYSKRSSQSRRDSAESQTEEQRQNKTDIATDEDLQKCNQWHIVALRHLIQSETYKTLKETSEDLKTVHVLDSPRDDQSVNYPQAVGIVNDNFPLGCAVNDLKCALGSNFVTHNDEVKEQVATFFKEGKHIQAAQMHDKLYAQMPFPFLTVPTCRELHNQISVLAGKKKKEELKKMKETEDTQIEKDESENED